MQTKSFVVSESVNGSVQSAMNGVVCDAVISAVDSKGVGLMDDVAAFEVYEVVENSVRVGHDAIYMFINEFECYKGYDFQEIELVKSLF